ncbi:MAG: hypothetical protein ACREEL_09730 [Stellaceae bacterium]
MPLPLSRIARSTATAPRGWLLVALVLVLPASRNIAAGIADLRGPAESSHAFMVGRDATLRRLEAAGTPHEAVLPVIAKADFPRSYVFHADIRGNAEFWINRWTARYYGLAAIRAADTAVGQTPGTAGFSEPKP